MPNDQAAAQYVKRIRSVQKRAYAQKYLDWMMRGMPESETPGWDVSGLSFIARQAVRHQLHAICFGKA